MSEYVDFHYMPLEGKITGEQVLKQTEDAINDLGNKVYNLDVDEERIDEAIENSNQAIDTANSALSAVTTDRAVWKNTVAEMKATDIDLGVTAVTRGEMVFNDGNGAFYGVRSEKSGDVESDDTVFLNNGNVAERLKQMNFIAKGNNIIYVTNVGELIASDAVIGNVYGTAGYHTSNDGGNGVYTIRAKDVADVDDGGSIIFLNNGNVAELITDGTVSYKQFGAVADGVENDYDAIKSCHLYANASGQSVVNRGGRFYAAGVTINVSTDILNNGTVYVVGSPNTLNNPLFKVSHDSVTSIDNIKIRDFMSNNFTLTDSRLYGKCFVIKTNTHLGWIWQTIEGVYQPTKNETIQETMIADWNYTELAMDDYDTVKDWTVNVTDITDAAEPGYEFSGFRIESKDSGAIGNDFLLIERNNCIVRNVEIAARNEGGQNGLITLHTANNVLVENIVIANVSIDTDWGYPIVANYSANVVFCKILESLGGSHNSISGNFLKNYTLRDSIVRHFGAHSNEYGSILAENCTLHDADIGYGNGNYILRNCKVATYVTFRTDLLPIYRGEILIENCNMKQGVYFDDYAGAVADADADATYFNTIPVPYVTIRNSKISMACILNNISADKVAKLSSFIFVKIEKTSSGSPNNLANTKCFRFMLKDTNYTNAQIENFYKVGYLFTDDYFRKNRSEYITATQNITENNVYAKTLTEHFGKINICIDANVTANNPSDTTIYTIPKMWLNLFSNDMNSVFFIGKLGNAIISLQVVSISDDTAGIRMVQAVNVSGERLTFNMSL